MESASGAIDNASGAVSAPGPGGPLAKCLLLEDAEVWLVATGAKDAWMSGMYHFVRSAEARQGQHLFSPRRQRRCACAPLRDRQGLLHRFPASPEMVRAAERVAGELGATPG